MFENHFNLEVIDKKNLKSVILCGGKSARMGYDKCLIHYHGLPQWAYINKLMLKQGLDVVISCRKDQIQHFKDEKCIVDEYLSIGPMGGILSVFNFVSDSALLVVACDYPLIKENDIEWLIRHRDQARDAVIMGKDTLDFEPTFGIYENSSECHFKNSFEKKDFSLRRAINHMDFRILGPLHENVLKQANEPFEKEQLLQIINQNST